MVQRLLREAHLQFRSRQIVGNDLHQILPSQASGHANGIGVMLLCLLQLIQAAVAVTQKEAALRHDVQAALPVGLIHPPLKAHNRIAVFTLPEKPLSCLQEKIAPVRLPKQLLEPFREAQVQLVLPFIHSRDKILHILRGMPICEPGKQQPVQKERTVPVVLSVLGQRRPQLPDAFTGKQAVIPLFKPVRGLPAELRFLSPQDTQTAEQQIQDLRTALCLPLLNLRQIGHGADSFAQRFLRPIRHLPPLTDENPLQSTIHDGSLLFQ